MDADLTSAFWAFVGHDFSPFVFVHFTPVPAFCQEKS